MPDISFPQIDVSKAAADLNQVVKEGAYVAVGLGVLGFQRAQVRRVELTKQLTGIAKQLEAQVGQMGDLGTQVEAYAKLARSQAETARDEFAQQFGEQFTAATKMVGGQISTAREQFGEVAKTIRSYAGIS